MWFACSATTAICENSDGVLLAPTVDLCTIHPEKLFLCYNQYCVKTIVLQQLWLVLVLSAWGEVKGLGGFLLLLAALADTPSYIPIIIPCMSRPKILTDRDLRECSCFLFSNHRYSGSHHIRKTVKKADNIRFGQPSVTQKS